jgi:branched-chain amino acid transport system permease protein
MKTYLILAYGWIRQEIFAIPGRIIGLIFFLFLFCAPLITQEPYFLRTLVLACIFAIFAISWDVLSGFTGQLSLGHGVFFGVAAYATALLNIHLHWPPWLTIPAGGVLSVLCGLLVGLPALRLRGMYLGLVTLAFPIILVSVVYLFSAYSGVELGLFGLQGLSQSLNFTYYLVVGIFLLSAFIMYKVTAAGSKFLRIGIILHAIREDEIAARSSGIRTTRYKFIAFAVSGFFAGVAGGLYAHFLKVTGPSSLELFFSFQVILWTIFGGTATIYGAAVGVFLLFPMMEALSLFAWGEQFRFIIFALILILTLFLMPEGISVWILDKLEIKCPRCKLINAFTRKKCRACRADLKDKGISISPTHLTPPIKKKS